MIKAAVTHIILHASSCASSALRKTNLSMPTLTILSRTRSPNSTSNTVHTKTPRVRLLWISGPLKWIKPSLSQVLDDPPDTTIVFGEFQIWWIWREKFLNLPISTLQTPLILSKFWDYVSHHLNTHLGTLIYSSEKYWAHSNSCKTAIFTQNSDRIMTGVKEADRWCYELFISKLLVSQHVILVLVILTRTRITLSPQYNALPCTLPLLSDRCLDVLISYCSTTIHCLAQLRITLFSKSSNFSLHCSSTVYKTNH